MDLKLSMAIARAKRKIQQISREYCRRAEVVSFGATDINPRHLAFWIISQTDKERERMRSTPKLVATFRQELLASGYPSDAVPQVGFEFESRETVDREYDGNLWYAMK